MNISRITAIIIFLIFSVTLVSCQAFNKDPDIGDFILEKGDPSETDIEESRQNSIKAYKYYQNKEYKKAIKHFDKAVILNPNEYRNYSGLGICFYALNEVDTASEFFVEALYINPDDLISLSGLASIYYEIKQYNKAIEYCNKIIKLDPGNPKNYKLLGDIYSTTGYKEEALKYYKKSLELGPENKALAEKVQELEK